MAKAGKKAIEPGKNATATPLTLVPLTTPTASDPTRADRVFPGKPIPPIVLVKTFSADEWEGFTQEWANSLKKQYHTVMRCSGRGDMGRDVVAHTGEISKRLPWDNFQCKHYDHPLTPGDIWVELGKVCYYTYLGHYTVPRKYYFVCPHDVGTTLVRLLEQPQKLKSELIEKWGEKCSKGGKGICSVDVPLAGKLKEHVEAFPFDVFSFMPVLKVIEAHRGTPWYVHRFGGGLPDRPEVLPPPAVPTVEEIPYITELFRAYNEKESNEVRQDQIAKWPELSNHFKLTRASFYSAESLKAFSRDHLPEKEFEQLQDTISNGVQETYSGTYDNGYKKVIEVTKAAINLPITDHALVPVLKPADRRGVCHQLVNTGQFRWTK